MEVLNVEEKDLNFGNEFVSFIRNYSCGIFTGDDHEPEEVADSFTDGQPFAGTFAEKNAVAKPARIAVTGADRIADAESKPDAESESA